MENKSRKYICIRLGTILLFLSIIGVIPSYAEPVDWEDMSIRLQSIHFDPALSVPSEKPGLHIREYPAGISSYIVQLNDSTNVENKKQISNIGAKFYGYVPNNAFIVRMDNGTRQKVEVLPFVRWVGIYQPAYRIAPSIHGSLETENKAFVNILLFDVSEKVVISKVQVLGGDIIAAYPDWIRVRINGSKISEIANIDGVMWIEKYSTPRLYNNESAKIMNVDPIVWATNGLNGSGQIVAVADTGLDTGANNETMHDDFEGRIGSIHSWPIQSSWNQFIENPGADDGASDLDGGHGTHVSGSVLGNGTRSSGNIKGTAYGARLVFQAIEQYVNWTPPNEYPRHLDGYYLVGLPDNLTDLFQEAYNDGARIHSNSWGDSDSINYTLNSQQIDTFMWNHKNMTILFAAGNEGNDSNSDGIIDYKSLSSQASAKNSITVGASENNRSTGGLNLGGACDTYGSCWPNNFPANPIRDDRLSNNSNGMVAFSSRGSTNDNRIKPDVVAPGTNVLSTRSSVANGTGWGVFNQYYLYMGGTSMATPLTAGAAALVRQYYMERRSHTPNASLIKATLINGAFDMPGQYAPDETGTTPNNNEGWGRVDLASSIFPASPKVLLFNDSGLLSSTGQNQSFYFNATNTTVPLKITMAWTDYPAIVPAGGLVNDLDIIITSPSGEVYNGNDFTLPFNDTFDRTNNVEQIRITTPATGTYKITVNASKIQNGPQDFSFVITGTVNQFLPGGGDYRKNLTITGTTAGAQTNYQMKLTVYNSSGTDSPGIVYLGGNARSDFGDLRFTKSDGVTLLDYWIESYTSGVSATVWVEVDSIPASPNTASIYLYYGNPSATSASNGPATFKGYGDFSTDEGFTWIDQGASESFGNSAGQLRSNNGYAEFVSASGSSRNDVYKSIPSTYNFYYESKVYYSSGSGNLEVLGISDSTGTPYATTTSKGIFVIIDPYPTHLKTHIFASNGAGSQIYAGPISISGGSWTYWVVVTRYNQAVTLKIYSDQAKTSLVGQTTLTLTSGYDNSFTFMHPLFWDIDSYSITGYADDVRIRNYVTPEPTGVRESTNRFTKSHSGQV